MIPYFFRCTSKKLDDVCFDRMQTIEDELEMEGQFTLNGKRFRRHPYGDVKLYYKWSCPKPCRYCRDKPHTSRCFDWGANYLFRRYKDEKKARIKVRNKLLFEMKYDNDTWFVLGTTKTLTELLVLKCTILVVPTTRDGLATQLLQQHGTCLTSLKKRLGRFARR